MSNPLFTIILPTLNESKNVRPIVEGLDGALKDYSGRYEIIFADDSTDDTLLEIERVSKEHGHISFIHRTVNERTGLATAFVNAFYHANGKYIVCMDADLQHPAERVLDFIKVLEEKNKDIVIATRYGFGGKASGLENSYRHFVSFASRIYAWTVLPQTRRTSDPGSGYFAFRKSIISGLNFDGLRGYKILIDILVRRPKAKIFEIPIIFGAREHEESKSTMKQGIDFLRHTLYLFVHWRVLKINYLKIFVNRKVQNRLLLILAILFVLLMVASQIQTGLQAVIYITITLLAMQGFFALFLMIFCWEDPERVLANRSPKTYESPELGFSILIPAKHEENVIQDTIKSIHAINYPSHLKEILLLINDTNDEETIRLAEEQISKLGENTGIELITYSGLPTSKPRGLNIGLKHAKKDIVTIFDAEDEIHPDILNIINTTMKRSNVEVVQSGVQLMNYQTSWYSLFNVLEYFFWFKSSLHFFAKQNLIPLGGNTVFFKRSWLIEAGGWDEVCLTEDADIGIRLSLMGARTKVIYDELHVTKEETPPSIGQLIKQRTRWNQGFIQIFLKGDWFRLPTFSQRLLSMYVLTWPFVQGLLFMTIPLAIYLVFFVEMPILLSIFTNIPLYIFLLFIILNNIGIYEFTKHYSLPYSYKYIPLTVVFFFPYQLILGVSSLRAMLRQFLGNTGWEKTLKLNRHRAQVKLILNK